MKLWHPTRWLAWPLWLAVAGRLARSSDAGGALQRAAPAPLQAGPYGGPSPGSRTADPAPLAVPAAPDPWHSLAPHYAKPLQVGPPPPGIDSDASLSVHASIGRARGAPRTTQDTRRRPARHASPQAVRTPPAQGTASAMPSAPALDIDESAMTLAETRYRARCAALADDGCQADHSDLMALFDIARRENQTAVVDWLWHRSSTEHLFQDFLRAYESEARALADRGYEASSETVLREFAEKAYLLGWRRELCHLLLTDASPSMRRYLAHPGHALSRVAQHFGVDIDACRLYDLDDSQLADLMTLSALLLNELHYQHAYGHSPAGPMPQRFDRGTVRQIWHERIQRSWLMDQALADFASNPYPNLLASQPGARYDGLCFRGAEHLDVHQDKATLQAARPYRPGNRCLPSPAPLSVPRVGVIGTLFHSFQATLDVVSAYLGDEPRPARQTTEEALEALSEAVHRWESERDFPYHPGWFAALHLAYSSAYEPLSAANAGVLWRNELYHHVAKQRELSNRRDKTRQRDLEARLNALPKASPDLDAADLQEWLEFFSAWLPNEVARRSAAAEAIQREIGQVIESAGPGSDRVRVLERRYEEASRTLWALQAWEPATNLTGVLFYSNEFEHLKGIANYLRERLDALKAFPLLDPFKQMERMARLNNREAFDNLLALLYNENFFEGEPRPMLPRDAESGEAAMRRLLGDTRTRLGRHPVVLARARETLRLARRVPTPEATAAQVQRLIQEAQEEEAGLDVSEQAGAWLDLLPVVGPAEGLARSMRKMDLIDAMLNGVMLGLDLDGMSGLRPMIDSGVRRIAHWVLDDLLSPEMVRLGLAVPDAGAEAFTRIRWARRSRVYLDDESRWALVVGVGSTYREIDTDTGRLLADRVVYRDARTGKFLSRAVMRSERFLSLSSEEAAHGYTCRQFDTVIRPSALMEEAAMSEVFVQVFRRIFAVDPSSDDDIVRGVTTILDDAYAYSPTLRRLFNAFAARQEPWTLVAKRGSRFQTSFATQNFMEVNRIDLGHVIDLEGHVYMSAVGEAPLQFQRAVVHELIHALTAQPDLFELDYIDKQRFRLQRAERELEEINASFNFDNPLHVRRRTALTHLRDMLVGEIEEGQRFAARHRGPVVYLTDRVLQEAGYRYAPRLMYLAGEEAKPSLQTMAQYRTEARMRVELENDYLDRIWNNAQPLQAASKLFDGALPQRMTLAHRSAFDRRLQRLVDCSPPQSPLAFAPGVGKTLPLDKKNAALAFHQRMARHSPLYARLLEAWRRMSDRVRGFSFALSSEVELHPSRRFELIDPAKREIPLSLRGCYMSSRGLRPLSLERLVVMGTLQIVCADLGFGAAEPEEEASAFEHRGLVAMLENEILKDLDIQEPVRVAATHVLDDNEDQAYLHITLARRLAMLEDEYYEKHLSPRRSSSRLLVTCLTPPEDGEADRAMPSS